MSGFIVCRSPKVGISNERLLAIYRREPTRRLLALQRALQTERLDATGAESRAFCDQRLPLVAQVLAEQQRKPHPREE